MTKQTKMFILLSWISSMSLLTGCATSMGRVPEHSPTMLQVYNAAMHDSSNNSMNALRQRVAHTTIATADPSSDLRSNQITKKRAASVTDWGTAQEAQKITGRHTYVVSDLQSLDQQFPRLPDPEIELYVYPHLAETSEVPVRGYKTAFTLYNKDYFALPGELASPQTSTRSG